MPRTLKIAVICLLPVVAYGAPDTAWNVARWEALVAHLPAPPATLAQTAGMAGAVRDAHGDVVLGPTDPGLRQSRSEYHAALAALNAASARGLPGGAGAMELANRMEHAPPDQRTAMAMQYAMQASATSGTALNDNAARAQGDATRYVERQKPRIEQALAAAQTELRKLQIAYAARHQATDAVLHQAYYDCPTPPACGDRSNCSPDPGCVRAVNARLPKMVVQHRQIAQAELTAGRTVYLGALATLQPILLHACGMFAAADKAGAAPTPGLVMDFSTIGASVARLQELDAAITIRAAFWQGIRPAPVAPDYFKFSIPADYRFALGKGDLTRPPDGLPKGW